MSWSDEDRHQFVNYLLELGTINKAAMMEAIYQALIESHERIFTKDSNPEKVGQALDTVIEWFEEKEKYEYCQKIKQIKECLKSK